MHHRLYVRAAPVVARYATLALRIGLRELLPIGLGRALLLSKEGSRLRRLLRPRSRTAGA